MSSDLLNRAQTKDRKEQLLYYLIDGEKGEGAWPDAEVGKRAGST